uniref:Uncharacterized protein n=1 Tax=Candidatus Kentrum sp. SD TaxID=2126332 RepID=A0A450YDJ8_9GAMM|nr:MAG: hypothetical protein BECKSD772F_GA0070984_104424 [Candidatus Kentron sp. SD]VFK44995.1 MAG: hypothetical protein BECKSD772E_GA0070983_104623 [Candidatus Kentron sp. SD]
MVLICVHSSNNVIALHDETDREVYRKRFSNNLNEILEELASYQKFIEELVVGSTYD